MVLARRTNLLSGPRGEPLGAPVAMAPAAAEVLPPAGTRAGLTTDPGPPPRVAWLPVDRLEIDRRYQRPVSKDGRGRIGRIAAGFRWALFQPLTVAEDAQDGEPLWWVIDGQHRLEASRQVGLARLPCYIVDAPSVEAQAAQFVALNRDRAILLPTQLHRAAVVAGEAEALRIEAVCRAAGVTVAQRSHGGDGLPPGQTISVKKIAWLLGKLGDRPVREALAVIREAAGERRDQLRAELIAAVAMLLADTGWAVPFYRERLVSAVASREARDWLHAAKERSRDVGGSTAAVLAELIKRAYGRVVA